MLLGRISLDLRLGACHLRGRGLQRNRARTAKASVAQLSKLDCGLDANNSVSVVKAGEIHLWVMNASFGSFEQCWLWMPTIRTIRDMKIVPLVLCVLVALPATAGA